MPAGQSCPPRYEALLQLREAISLHRNLPMRGHELTRRLHSATDFIQLAPHDVVIHPLVCTAVKRHANALLRLEA